MDLLLRIVTCIESPILRLSMLEWLNDQVNNTCAEFHVVILVKKPLSMTTTAVRMLAALLTTLKSRFISHLNLAFHSI